MLADPVCRDLSGDVPLRAADAALFVLSASDGVDESTRLVWEECAAVGMPRAVVATHLDKERADFDELVAMGALYVNPEAKLLSILFFTYGFQVERLGMGMTLAVITFLPLVLIGVALQRLQRRLQY